MPTKPGIALALWDQGGALARALDLDAFAAALAKLSGVAGLWRPADLEGGLEELAQAFREGRADRLLMLGRATPAQRGLIWRRLSATSLNPHLVHWLDLQEESALPPGFPSEPRRKKALLITKMHLADLRLARPLMPVAVPAEPTALVVGGGVAGLGAALALAKAGVEVHLAERTSALGGKVALLSGFYPLGCDPACGLSFTLEALRATGKARLHTLSELAEISGGPGAFRAVLRRRPGHVDPERCDGCGACAEACPVQLPDLAEWWQDEPPLNAQAFALAGAPAKAIGPTGNPALGTSYRVLRERCPEGCDACVAACPAGAVRLDEDESRLEVGAGAVILATGWDPYPLSRLTEYGYPRSRRVVGNLEMEGLLSERGLPSLAGLLGAEGKPPALGFVQCAGSRDLAHLPYCSGVCCSATLKQARRLKQLWPELTVYIFYQDMRTPGFEEDLYRDVAAMEGVVFVRGLPAGVREQDQDGRLALRCEDAYAGRELKLSLDLLVLAGGMTPSPGAAELGGLLGLPAGPHGFFPAHLQCHPEESGRSGVFAAGCAREPMNVARSLESAARAALAALPFMQGEAWLAPHLPQLDQGKCDQCKRCVEECPFGSWSLDERGFPRLDLARCRQCGICMGSCPLTAISLPNRTVNQTAKAVEVLGEGTAFAGKEPVILAFLCRHDALIAARAAAAAGLALPPGVVLWPLNCAGSLNNALVADALSLGVDGVFIGGCAEDQCHFREGSRLAGRRSRDLGDKLAQMRLEPERVRFAHLGIGDAGRFAELVGEYAAALRALGPNPFRM